MTLNQLSCSAVLSTTANRLVRGGKLRWELVTIHIISAYLLACCQGYTEEKFTG